MSTLQTAFAEENAVICDDAYGMTVDGGEAGEKRRSVCRLELRELAAVNNASNNFVHVYALLQVGPYNTAEFVSVI